MQLVPCVPGAESVPSPSHSIVINAPTQSCYRQSPPMVPCAHWADRSLCLRSLLGGGGRSNRPQGPRLGLGLGACRKSHLLSLLTAWLGDMEGFSTRDAQGELPSSGSRPTGSVPQDLVRVCKNQRKHTSRDLDVSIRNPAYTAGHRRGRIFSAYLLFLDAEAGAAAAGGRALGSHPQPVQLPTWWGRPSQRQASLCVTAQPPSAPIPRQPPHVS